MKVISIIAQKGGVAKTTLTAHLGVAATQVGMRTALIDTDPQRTCFNWGQERKADVPEVVPDLGPGIPKLVQAGRDHGADLVIIDTPPAAEAATRYAAQAADLILVPCQPLKFDLSAIQTTLRLAETVRKPAAVVLTRAPVRCAIIGEARTVLERDGVTVAPTIMHQRAPYFYSVIDGRTVLEYEPAGKAAEEIRELFQWACQLIGLQACQPLVRPTGQEAA